MDDKQSYRSSESGGVKPLSIRGVYEDERYRVSEEYNDEERMWRKQWYKDQILAHNEPRHVPELEKELKNPLRRLASAPWEFMEKAITPVLGNHFAVGFRYLVPKLLVVTAITYFSWYHIKYNENDWTRVGGIQVASNRPTAFPGDPGFPLKRERHNPGDYYDRGFKSRKVFLD